MKYLVYSDYIRDKAEDFLNKNQISPDTLLAIHLRVGSDFVRSLIHIFNRYQYYFVC